jgi:hypothetical protein
MKVERLIELLQDCPPHSEVLVQVDEGGEAIDVLFVTEDNGEKIPGKRVVIIEC